MKLLPIMVILGTLVVFLYVFNTMSFPMISSSLGGYFTALMPGLLFTLFGAVTMFEAKNSPGVMGCFAVMGVGLAIMIGSANTVGLVTNAMLAPATLEQFQAVIIIFALFLGGIVYAKGR
jgi:hypothetical protein